MTTDERTLQLAVNQARQSLAEAEAMLSELTAAMEPSTDLEEEERRLAEVGVKRQALERVIVARRRVLEEAEETLHAARAPRLRAELAAAWLEVDSLGGELIERLFELYDMTEPVFELRRRIGELRLGLGDSLLFGGPLAQIEAARGRIATALEVDLGVARRASDGILRRRDFAAEAAKKENEAKRREQEATVQRIKARRQAMLEGGYGYDSE